MQPAVRGGRCVRGRWRGRGVVLYKRREAVTIVELSVWSLKDRIKAVCLLLTQSATDSL